MPARHGGRRRFASARAGAPRNRLGEEPQLVDRRGVRVVGAQAQLERPGGDEVGAAVHRSEVGVLTQRLVDLAVSGVHRLLPG